MCISSSKVCQLDQKGEVSIYLEMQSRSHEQASTYSFQCTDLVWGLFSLVLLDEQFKILLRPSSLFFFPFVIIRLLNYATILEYFMSLSTNGIVNIRLRLRPLSNL